MCDNRVKIQGFDFLKLLIQIDYKRRNMNSKFWFRKALSLCLVVATIATYSMVTLANSGKIAGELLISGVNSADKTSYVKVNGETAQTGRSIFSASTIATPNANGAIVNLGKLGQIELASDTTLSLSFDEKGISGNLLAGRVTVLNATDAVNIKLVDGSTTQLKAGESAVATTGKAQDDTGDADGGSAWVAWALILGGAAAAIVIAATSDNNRITVGGNTTVISPTR
jgi:hypothetical protein